MQICVKILVLWLISYAQRARKCGHFFLKFNLSHNLQLLNVQWNFCSVMCYTVLIWTQILSFLTLGNNILLQSFNWPKWVHCVPTDIINAASIRIPRILKVKICTFDKCKFWTASSHHLQSTSIFPRMNCRRDCISSKTSVGPHCHCWLSRVRFNVPHTKYTTGHTGDRFLRIK